MRAFVAAVVLAAMSALPAKAAVLIDVLPEFNFFGGPGDGPQVVGTFNVVIPVGEVVQSASVSGTFGNSQATNSAPIDLFADGELIGSCIAGATCTTATTPELFDFPINDLVNLADGSSLLTAAMTNPGAIRLGRTVLTVVTAPPEARVPLPASALLLLGGLGVLGAVRARRAGA